MKLRRICVRGARFVARVLSLFLLGFVAFVSIAGGQVFEGFSTQSLPDIARATAFITMLIALATAWWRPRAGGAATIAATIAFYCADFAGSGTWPEGWVFPLFACAGILWFSSGGPVASGDAPRRRDEGPPDASAP